MKYYILTGSSLFGLDARTISEPQGQEWVF